jgi:hypothetical protein
MMKKRREKLRKDKGEDYQKISTAVLKRTNNVV